MSISFEKNLAEAMQHPNFEDEPVLREETAVLQALEKYLRERKMAVTF